MDRDFIRSTRSLRRGGAVSGGGEETPLPSSFLRFRGGLVSGSKLKTVGFDWKRLRVNVPVHGPETKRRCLERCETPPSQWDAFLRRMDVKEE